jgi:anti-anti-sigma factor
VTADAPVLSGQEASPPTARTIVRLDGALDAAAASALRDRLIGLLHPGIRLLVLDLSRVPSCDSAGLAVLVGAERRARTLGIVMRLAAPSVPVAKLLHLTGLDRALTIYPDLPGALADEQHERASSASTQERNYHDESPAEHRPRPRSVG